MLWTGLCSQNHIFEALTLYVTCLETEPFKKEIRSPKDGALIQKTGVSEEEEGHQAALTQRKEGHVRTALFASQKEISPQEPSLLVLILASASRTVRNELLFFKLLSLWDFVTVAVAE